MTTVTNPDHKASDGLVANPVDISLAPKKTDKEAETVTESLEQGSEELIKDPLGTDRVKLTFRIGRRMSSIYRSLAGPPFTQRDRRRAILSHAENVHRSI